MMELIMKAYCCLKNQKGQGLVEYALIIALIAVLLVASLTSVKDGIVGVFSNITSNL